MSSWSRDQDTILATMWNRGCAFSEIAAALGKTKNSIAGRKFRLEQTGVKFRKYTMSDRIQDAKIRLAETGNFVSPWTPERTQNLMDLWREGKSTSEISILMDVTVRAVTAKIARLRKQGHDLEKRSHIMSETATQKAKVSRITGMTYFSSPDERQKASDKGNRHIAALEDHYTNIGVLWADLRVGKCRGLTGETSSGLLYCGEPVYRESKYCKECRKWMFVKRAA